MERLELRECRIEAEPDAIHLAVREHLDVVAVGVKQLSDQLDPDAVRHAAVGDDGATLDQRRPLIWRDVRDPHSGASGYSTTFLPCLRSAYCSRIHAKVTASPSSSVVLGSQPRAFLMNVLSLLRP